MVGTRLIEILLKEHQVTIGDIVESKAYPALWKKCDVCSDEDLQKIVSGQDCIVNLAAAHRDDVRPLSLYAKTNVTGAEHVCKAASKAGVRHIVFTSSVAVYGFPKWDYDEDAPKEPFNESLMQKPDARRKEPFLKRFFLLALFLFQTCSSSIDAIGGPIASMQT